MKTPPDGTVLEQHIAAGEMPEGGWLRAARDAMGITQRKAAGRMKVSQQAFNQFESGELKASITLERLQRAAEAVDCELVYFIRPQGSTTRIPGSAVGRSATSPDETSRAQSAPAVSPAPAPVPDYSDELPVNLL